jgi:hypothetical protein
VVDTELCNLVVRQDRRTKMGKVVYNKHETGGVQRVNMVAVPASDALKTKDDEVFA